MTSYEIITIILLNNIAILIAFFIGMKFYKKDSPSLTPMEAIERKKEIKKAKETSEFEQEYYKVLSENIENYDGTEFGQKELPKRK